MTKKEIQLKKKEEMELITDPFCISIMNQIHHKALSKEEIAELLEEDPAIVSDYVDRLLDHGFLRVEEGQKGSKGYIAAADTYKLGDPGVFDGTVYNHWYLGLINHLENNIIDMLKLIDESGFKNSKAFFQELGYEKSSFANMVVYLDREGYQELGKILGDFLEKYGKPPEEDSEKKIKSYEFSFILHPFLTELRQEIKKRSY